MGIDSNDFPEDYTQEDFVQKGSSKVLLDQQSKDAKIDKENRTA